MLYEFAPVHVTDLRTKELNNWCRESKGGLRYIPLDNIFQTYNIFS